MRWTSFSFRTFCSTYGQPEVEAMKKNSNFFQLFLKKWWKTYSNTYQHHHRVFKYQGLRIWHRHVHTTITFSYRDHFTFPTFKTLACRKYYIWVWKLISVIKAMQVGNILILVSSNSSSLCLWYEMNTVRDAYGSRWAQCNYARCVAVGTLDEMNVRVVDHKLDNFEWVVSW